MNPSIANLLEQIRALEHELESELSKQHAKLGFGNERSRVLFEEDSCGVIPK